MSRRRLKNLINKLMVWKNLHKIEFFRIIINAIAL